jgi:hypothetical protein
MQAQRLAQMKQPMRKAEQRTTQLCHHQSVVLHFRQAPRILDMVRHLFSHPLLCVILGIRMLLSVKERFSTKSNRISKDSVSLLRCYLIFIITCPLALYLGKTVPYTLILKAHCLSEGVKPVFKRPGIKMPSDYFPYGKQWQMRLKRLGKWQGHSRNDTTKKKDAGICRSGEKY